MSTTIAAGLVAAKAAELMTVVVAAAETYGPAFQAVAIAVGVVESVHELREERRGKVEETN